jgi:hypothetical protein
MRRFSIRRLMIFIVVSAIGLAALRNANELWAETMLMTALIAVGVAILGAVFSRGRERAWWVGFALFGGCYLTLSDAPWIGDAFRHRLITTSLLGDLRNLMFGSNVRYLLIEKQALEDEIAKVQPATRIYDPVVASMRNSLKAIQDQLNNNRNVARRYDHFHSIGHALFALLAGLMGGTVAVWFHARRGRGETDAEELPRPPLQRAQDDGGGG